MSLRGTLSSSNLYFWTWLKDTCTLARPAKRSHWSEKVMQAGMFVWLKCTWSYLSLSPGPITISIGNAPTVFWTTIIAAAPTSLSVSHFCSKEQPPRISITALPWYLASASSMARLLGPQACLAQTSPLGLGQAGMALALTWTSQSTMVTLLSVVVCPLNRAGTHPKVRSCSSPQGVRHARIRGAGCSILRRCTWRKGKARERAGSMCEPAHAHATGGGPHRGRHPRRALCDLDMHVRAACVLGEAERDRQRKHWVDAAAKTAGPPSCPRALAHRVCSRAQACHSDAVHLLSASPSKQRTPLGDPHF